MCFSASKQINGSVAVATATLPATLPAATLPAATLPAGAVQCPIQHPFSKYGPNGSTVESCCKCQSQTKCKAAPGATHFNIGGSYAMMQPNDVVDKSKFLIIQLDC